MIFDTHAHYDQDWFDEDRDELLAGMKAGGIGRIVNIGCDLEASRRSIELAEQYDFIWAAAGVHPSDAVTKLDPARDEENLALISEMTDHEKVVAVGEIGLDYYWIKEPEMRERQKLWFRRQINLAREKGLPIVIHSREAAKDTLDIAKRGKTARCRRRHALLFLFQRNRARVPEYGILSGNRRCADLSECAGAQGSSGLRAYGEPGPGDGLSLPEPGPFQGKRNSSLNLPYVVSAFAQIKGISVEETEEITWNNAMRLYRMDA